MENLCLLFLGDSLIDFGNWPQRFSQHRVVSSGMPGEMAEGLLRRLPARTPVSPDAIILMTGTNNLFSGDTDFAITIDQIIGKLKARFPPSEIIITSLLPYEIPGAVQMAHRVNLELQEIAVQTGSLYFDLCSPFERVGDGLFEYDGVHLSEAGYQLWSEELLRFLSSQLAKGSD